MARVKDMINPLDPEGKRMLTHEETLEVRKYRRLRTAAKKDKRSGHPGRRAEGTVIEQGCALNIRDIYVNNMMGA